MRPMWAICTKSGQKSSRTGGGKFNHADPGLASFETLGQLGKFLDFGSAEQVLFFTLDQLSKVFSP